MPLALYMDVHVPSAITKNTTARFRANYHRMHESATARFMSP